jgi:hypothetical protein
LKHELKAGDEVDFLIPDSPDLAVWLEGENLMFSDAVDCRFEDYVAQFDLQLEKQQSMQPKDKDVVADDLYGPPSEEDDDWFHLPDFKLPSFDLPKLPSFDLPNFQRPTSPKCRMCPPFPAHQARPKSMRDPKSPKNCFKRIRSQNGIARPWKKCEGQSKGLKPIANSWKSMFIGWAWKALIRTLREDR